jgi:hypothetical protein
MRTSWENIENKPCNADGAAQMAGRSQMARSDTPPPVVGPPGPKIPLAGEYIKPSSEMKGAFFI